MISAYDFEPLFPGITLNMHPHVSADRKWVNLEVDATSITSNKPLDSVLSRQKNTVLFESKYRVRESDLFDLKFLQTGENFRHYQTKAIHIVRLSPSMAANPSIKPYIEGSEPGGDTLATRILADILAKDHAIYHLDRKKRYLQNIDTNGRSVVSLHDVLNDLNQFKGEKMKLVIAFNRNNKKLITCRFYRVAYMCLTRILSDSLPAIEMDSMVRQIQWIVSISKCTVRIVDCNPEVYRRNPDTGRFVLIDIFSQNLCFRYYSICNDCIGRGAYVAV